MFEDLVNSCRQLDEMLVDVQEDHAEFDPLQVAEMLRQCELKAMGLAREILAQRRYVLEKVLPDWEVTTREGMSPGTSPATGATTPVKSNEYVEQLIIEAIATSRYPERRVQEIRLGFYTDERETNYVWLVILKPTQDGFANTVTTVDTNDIRAWQEQQRKNLESGPPSTQDGIS